jgi:uridine phosphorylase
LISTPLWLHGDSKKLIEELKALRVVNMEMKASILFTLASIYEVMAGTVCAGATNRILGKSDLHAGTDNMIKVAN